MRKLALLMLLTLLSVRAWGEEPRNLDEAMRTLAGDLSTLQNNVQAAGQKQWIYNPSKLRITRSNAPLHKGADAKSQVLSKLPEGASARIVDKVGPWYAITLDNGKDKQTGWVEAAVAVPEPAAFGPYPVSPGDLYDSAMEQVKTLKQKYEMNPYIRITGFSIDVSVSPGISVDFEFK